MKAGEGKIIGTGYTRNDTSNNIADGKTINASDLDGEFDAIESAFNSSTGHTHDGTSAEGAPIEKTGPAQEYIFDGTAIYPKTNNTYDLGKPSAEFKNLYLDGTGNIDTLVADSGTVGGESIATASTTDTLTNKTIDSASNTLTIDFTEATVEATFAELNSAVSDATLVSLTGTETLTNKTLTSPDINTPDINTPDIDGGTIDNTVIGGTTPAAITGTTITADTGFIGDLTGDISGNADTVDNLDASSFLRSDAANEKVSFENKESSLSGTSDGDLWFDSSAGMYVLATVASASPALLWSSANFTAGSGLSVSYGSEDEPTLSADGLLFIDGTDNGRIAIENINSDYIVRDTSGTGQQNFIWRRQSANELQLGADSFAVVAFRTDTRYKGNDIVNCGDIEAATVSGGWRASFAQAQDGTVNNKIMTPLRTKQAVELGKGQSISDFSSSGRSIDTNYTNNTVKTIQVSVNTTGSVELNDNSGSGWVQLTSNQSATFLVPPTWSYRISGGLFSRWVEVR